MDTTPQFASLTGTTDVAPGLRIFRFMPRTGFDFLPGQFAVLGLPREGKVVERAYSIASAPHEPHLEFFIKLVSHGRLTPLLFALKPGDNISLRPFARGRFLPDPGARNHLMVATVTGVAPFISMLRHAVHTGNPGRFFLIHGASHAAELGYRAELEAMAAAARLTYLPTVSRPAENPDWSGAAGRAESHLQSALARWGLNGSNTTAYLCGHPGMVVGARALLVRLGFEEAKVRSESW